METTNLKDLFEKKIRVEAQVRSIESVFFNPDLEDDINYRPSYQRNYVWEPDKASYFIESILIGTEIPPLIFFVKDYHYEVIDGRQRFETIRKFIHNEFPLRKSALQCLSNVKEIAGRTFQDMPTKYQELFRNTKIRCVEFSFWDDGHAEDDEKRIKQEIFHRYNTGITPLKKTEIDKARYLHDDLNSFFKTKLQDTKYCDKLKKMLKKEECSTEILLKEIREALMLNKIPIKYYASGKQSVLDNFYDVYSQQTLEDEFNEVANSFFYKVDVVNMLCERLSNDGAPSNRLVAKSLFWALSIMETEKIPFEILKEKYNDIYRGIKSKEQVFRVDRSSFYQEIVARYQCIAEIFQQITSIDYRIFIDTTKDFISKRKNTLPKQTLEEQCFEDLRINKPEPTSEMVLDICRKVGNDKYLIRPAYQRKEVINRRKSSMIIESMLLNIKLPPIFVLKRVDGICEVIDGQQRLLSILGFMGMPYKDEQGNINFSEKNKYRLDLKGSILEQLNGCSYENLSDSDKKKIGRTNLWVVEINEQINEHFEATDLFVRLNNKPYPIKRDTFEMWNSFIDSEVIARIKHVSQSIDKWFYIRKNNKRMENENMLTILMYFQYLMSSNLRNEDLYPTKAIDIYKVVNHITVRLKGKYQITQLLEKRDNKEELMAAIDSFEYNFIYKLRVLLSNSCNIISDAQLNKALDELFLQSGSMRTQESFYLLWIFLHNTSMCKIMSQADKIKKEISNLYRLSRTDVKKCDFLSAIRRFEDTFGHYQDSKEYNMMFKPLHSFFCEDLKSAKTIYIYKENIIGDHFSTNTQLKGVRDNQILIPINPNLISTDFIASILMTNTVYNILGKKQDLRSLNVQNLPVPIVNQEVQDVFKSIYLYYLASYDYSLVRQFYFRLLEIMTNELYNDNYIAQRRLYILVNEALKKAKTLNMNNFIEVYNVLVDSQTSEIPIYLLQKLNYESQWPK